MSFRRRVALLTAAAVAVTVVLACAFTYLLVAHRLHAHQIEDARLLRHLRVVLTIIVLGGIALAALLGRLVADAVVAPVGRLTRAAEHVARTRDLSERIDTDPSAHAGRTDEIGRLAVSFNAMLDALARSMAALDASVHAQRQLVADASHELRTPVTSLRTNIEILQQAPSIDPADREHLFAEVIVQIEELTELVGDLIDLARGEQQPSATEEVRLDQVVQEALERAHRHAPDTPVEADLQPMLLLGVPTRLGRAVNNLIDNAVKYSPPGQPVQVRLAVSGRPEGEESLANHPPPQAGAGAGVELSVRDHGPGIAAEDLPHIFDRFYRGAEARGRPGSGLGLAIVRQVVEQHGGSIHAEDAPGGGTLMRVRLPRAEPIALGDDAASPTYPAAV